MNKSIATSTALGAMLTATVLAGDLPTPSAGDQNQKQPAKHKPAFRLLFSNDSTNIISNPKPPYTTRDALRPARINGSVDETTGVDVHMLQPGLGWVPWWKSEVGPADQHYEWFGENTALPVGKIGEYMLEGGDMAQVFVDRCRKRGISPFISLRLNDYHGNETIDILQELVQGNGRDKRYRFITTLAAAQSRFLLEHPHFRIAPDPEEYQKLTGDQRLGYIYQPTQRYKLRVARVLNWAIPEVRDHKFAFIEEICEKYDIDGFELDFMRHFRFFRLDETTSQQRVAIMTEFISKVRRLLDRTAKPGQRRWLCVRVPQLLAGHDPLGIDLVKWVAAGVDMVNLSCHFVSNMQTDLPEICRMLPDTPVYLELTFTSMRENEPSVYRKMTDEQFYTAAHLAYSRGGSGVSLFNFVYYRSLAAKPTEPPFHILKHLKDPDWLARQPQHYFLSKSHISTGLHSQFTQDRAVTPAGPSHFIMDMAPPTGGWKTEGRLRLQTATAMDGTELTLRFNGTKLAPTDDISEPYPNPYPDGLGTAETLRAWIVPVDLLRDGVNQIEVEMTEGHEMRLVFVDLAVK